MASIKKTPTIKMPKTSKAKGMKAPKFLKGSKGKGKGIQMPTPAPGVPLTK